MVSVLPLFFLPAGLPKLHEIDEYFVYDSAMEIKGVSSLSSFSHRGQP